MSRVWSLQDAKNRFSEVVNQAIQEGPQIVTRHGRETAVVISMEDYLSKTAPKNDLVDFFRSSPLAAEGVEMERDRDPGREVEL